MLDDALLETFMKGFYGYGSYFGDIWLVGKEEGGAASCEDVAARLRVWDERGRRTLEDVAAYHVALGAADYFSDNPTYQPTWRRLIALLCGASGIEPTPDVVKTYQQHRLGRLNGDHCLLEFLPLPAPSTGHWFYDACSALPYLQSRRTYYNEIWGKRIVQLRQKIQQYQPRAVIFYSTDRHYIGAWQEIAGTAFVRDEALGVFRTKRGTTTFLVTEHPTSQKKGVSNDYFYRIGQYSVKEENRKKD